MVHLMIRVEENQCQEHELQGERKEPVAVNKENYAKLLLILLGNLDFILGEGKRGPSNTCNQSHFLLEHKTLFTPQPGKMDTRGMEVRCNADFSESNPVSMRLAQGDGEWQNFRTYRVAWSSLD